MKIHAAALTSDDLGRTITFSPIEGTSITDTLKRVAHGFDVDTVWVETDNYTPADAWMYANAWGSKGFRLKLHTHITLE
jgi:cysteine sulfinate desulfinase/cysteine desulfurase-like protein